MNEKQATETIESELDGWERNYDKERGEFLAKLDESYVSQTIRWSETLLVAEHLHFYVQRVRRIMETQNYSLIETLRGILNREMESLLSYSGQHRSTDQLANAVEEAEHRARQEFVRTVGRYVRMIEEVPA
jgi:hypothetical protein